MIKYFLILQIINLPSPYLANCTKRNLDILRKTNYTYSKSACLMQCLSHFVIKTCGCRPIEYKGKRSQGIGHPVISTPILMMVLLWNTTTQYLRSMLHVVTVISSFYLRNRWNVSVPSSSKWNLEVWTRMENLSTQRKTSQSRGGNHQQTQPSNGVDAGIWSRPHW